jgi:hypothetical protein
MSEDLHDPELTTLETALAGLRPTPGGLDRELLMFRAGQASARRWPWPWQGATLALAVAVAVLGTLLARRPTIREIVLVEVDKPAPALVEVEMLPPPVPAAVPPPALPRERVATRSEYLRLRDEMLQGRTGPESAAPTYSVPAAFALDQLLDRPTHSLDPISRSRLQRALLKSGEPL